MRLPSPAARQVERWHLNTETLVYCCLDETEAYSSNKVGETSGQHVLLAPRVGGREGGVSGQCLKRLVKQQ